MKIIQFISNFSIPFIILIILLYGILEKKKVFDLFIKGVIDGITIVKNIFPTLLGLFMAINMLRSSGIIDLIITTILPFCKILNLKEEILPLMMLRPISGSAAMAIAIDMMNKYGVDSLERKYYFNNYGFYRNHILYNCNLYRHC